MVSQCKICGERTAGHRQYCPYCRRTSKGRNSEMPEEFKFIFRLILSSFVFIPLLTWIILLLIIFSIHYLIKTIVLLIRKEKKKFHINNFEKTLMDKVKNAFAVGSKVNRWISNDDNPSHANRRSNWGQQRMVNRKILR
ncbi:hypothetical protein HYW76_00670 [Candidatus Pacearchaeota archaeon]|nr:hypothetical protein [Candidatus Pacearchaeota archaeon]